MRYVVLGILSLACGGCISMAMERSPGNLRALSTQCLAVPAAQVVITDRQEDLYQVSWTARTGEKACRCTQPTIGNPATCVAL